jgi:hypothetical protein
MTAQQRKSTGRKAQSAAEVVALPPAEDDKQPAPDDDLPADAEPDDHDDEPSESALVKAVRRKHRKAAEKLAVHQRLDAAVRSAPGGHRELTEEEARLQNDNALTMEEMTLINEIEWGTYVAWEDIYHNGVPAYLAGQPVPISNVERWGYDQTDPPQVRLRTAKKG